LGEIDELIITTKEAFARENFKNNREIEESCGFGVSSTPKSVGDFCGGN